MNEMDPLCVDPPGVITYLFEEWEDDGDNARSGNPPFRIDLAPDYLHKANISGGPAYSIELPFLGVDPVFANEAHELPFVDYLRLCFRWAGFPRLEGHATRPGVREFVERMTKGIEPF